jgi:hypothetical protein
MSLCLKLWNKPANFGEIRKVLRWVEKSAKEQKRQVLMNVGSWPKEENPLENIFEEGDEDKKHYLKIYTCDRTFILKGKGDQMNLLIEV